jgi:catechol 2,3-dioxygenase-like lactoylglutathione lyase family enzyme
MKSRLTIITLGVKNLEVSTAFYKEVFAWNLHAQSNENIRFFKLNGILLSLYPLDKLAKDAQTQNDGEGFKGFTLAHNVASVAEVDELFKNFKYLNVTILKEPEAVFWGGYSGYIEDPDGYLWEIAYNPFLEMDENGNVQ